MSELPFVNEDGRLLVESIIIKLEGGYELVIPNDKIAVYQFENLGFEIDEGDNYRNIMAYVLNLNLQFSVPPIQWDAAADNLGAALAPGIIQATKRKFGR